MLPEEQGISGSFPDVVQMIREVTCKQLSLEQTMKVEGKARTWLSSGCTEAFTHCEKQHRHREDDGNNDSQPHCQDENVIFTLVLVKEVGLNSI